MATRKLRRLGALTAGLSVALLATACGGDDGESAATTTAAAGASTTAATGSTSGSPSTTAPAARPSSMAGWDALWAEERDAVVKKIKDNGWGTSADGKTLTGPDGFTVDLSKCPAGWSATEGLSDTKIKIGHTMGLSGIYANPTTRAGVGTMLDYYGAQGAFKDVAGKTRTVDYITKDDATDPARTPPLVDELIDSDKIFSDITSASANTFKVYDKLNERCIPHSVILSGHPAWGDPVNHPWTAGYQVAYNTESNLWGAFIDEHLSEFGDGKVTIATLALNNDYGKVATDALKAYLDASPNAERFDLVSEKVELAAPVVTDPMTTLASKEPDFLFVMVGGGQCAAVINEAAQNGMKESVKYKFLPNICLPVGPAAKAVVGGDGAQSDGWWVVNGSGVDTKDKAMQSDAFVAFAREQLKAHGSDPDGQGDYNTGLGGGWLISQIVQIAGQLPGGLTRANFLLAERTMDMTSPMLLPGMKLNMSGDKDPYLFEGAIFQKWSSAEQVWKNQGEPIDVSGTSKPCAWNQATQVCA
jgi:branched-chain amino acid transport system substrate-binding protein